MSNTNVYGFITDDAMHLNSSIIVDLIQSYDQGYGVLRGECANYFVNKGTLVDGRIDRLSVIDSFPPRGNIAVVFDQNKCDIELIKKFTSQDIEKLFNIIERITYQGTFQDSNVETLLTTDEAYEGYEAGSFRNNPIGNVIKITNTNRDERTFLIHNWIEFTFVDNNADSVSFHLWLSREAFSHEYPFTTITKVIPPYNPQLLLDPATLLSSTGSTILSNSSNYIFAQTDVETAARDQNGIFTYTTTYKASSTTKLQLNFALAYCGPKVPSSLACRQAISEYFLSEVGVSESALLELFPEIGVQSRFILVPLWDLSTNLTYESIYPSILKYSAYKTRADAIFSGVTADFRYSHLETLTNAQNKMILMSMPDGNNDASKLSLLDMYPTYQDYSTQGVGWKYLSAEAQEFAGKLIRCLAVATGNSASTEFSTIIDGEFTYYTFLTSTAEFYLMTQESYTNFLTKLGVK